MLNKSELHLLKQLINETQFNNIKLLLSGNKNPFDYEIIKKWNDDCDNLIMSEDLILAAIAEELNYNVQPIFDDDGMKLFSYIDVGDEFGITIMLYYIKNKFILTTFASIIEAIEEDMLEMFIND